MASGIGLSEAIFSIALIATFIAAILARRQPIAEQSEGLAGYKLNRWLVGLSAGTTANSGFIVTAAVGLGYAYGLHWIFLPISWLLGDLVFWYFFPARINALGQQSRATTLSELLRYDLSGPHVTGVVILSAAVIFVCLAGYTSAQWLAGQKFLAGAFGVPEIVALIVFAILIISYSSIGGFRGSVYTDTLQAFIRIAGTIVALVAVSWFAFGDVEQFSRGLAEAGRAFMNPFPGDTLATACAFIFGFAAAAIGFGLGQPQIVSRYFAGRNPNETRSAWWVYIGFVQFTWIAMTVFGIMLRGVMPEIADPEAGLSIFFQQKLGAVATGLIAADVFATIASTSNGLLIAMAQAVNHDLIPTLLGKQPEKLPLALSTLLIGAMTMTVSMMIHGTVVTVALSSVSMMGAGLAGAVMIKVMRWPHTAFSLLCVIVCGLISAAGWKYFGYDSTFNEAGIGIFVGLAVNWLVLRINALRLPLRSTRQ